MPFLKDIEDLALRAAEHLAPLAPEHQEDFLDKLLEMFHQALRELRPIALIEDLLEKYLPK